MQLISVQKNLADFSFFQVLDDVEYELRFTWNMRGGWFLAMSDTAGDPLFLSRRICVGQDLLVDCRSDPRCPTGVLVAMDMTGQDIEAGYLDLCSGPSEFDLQGRVAVLYVALEEIPE